MYGFMTTREYIEDIKLKVCKDFVILCVSLIIPMYEKERKNRHYQIIKNVCGN